MWAVSAVLTVSVAGAGARPAAASGAAAPSPPGWVVDRVRFEPLDVPLDVGGVGTYKGVIEIAPAGGAVAVVDELGLDDYMKGISEVPVQWPAEAQKAQAIAARTYALWEMAHKAKGEIADICPTQACQVYAGMAKERRPGAAAWSAAVDATAGQVLVWRGGPINAKYSSTNGGRSVAGGQPYLRAVDDPDDAVSPYHRWRVALPLTTLAGLFATPGELMAVTRVGESVVFDWTASDATTGQLVVPVADFRSRVNAAIPAPEGLPLTLPSVRFNLASSGDGSAVADGQGWGHGIGLSQYGALGKALRGMPAPDILASYYAGLRPVALTPQQLPSAIRVLLDPSRASATVGGAGRFRVVDGTGNVIALAASGAWEVRPAGGRRLRIVAPADQARPPSVDGLRLERGMTALGESGRLHFRLAAPAAVQLTVQLPTAAPVVTDLGIREAGDQVLAVPPSTVPGGGQVVLRVDAGGGRTTVAPLAFTVAHSAPAPPPRLAAVEGMVASPALDRWLEIGALMLLLGVSSGLVRSRRQLH
ncbi:MAG: stage sporulation protein [Actinomycetota bacterium]|nr:stage sporulation protein [Actinomycetota bacterium]